jgi:YfiH family protein
MEIIKADLLTDIKSINHGFFNRLGGKSTGVFESLNVGLNRGDDDATVISNRRSVAGFFGLGVRDMVVLNQAHGDDVHVIDLRNFESYRFDSVAQALSKKGDAIITDIPGLLIGVNTADCAPILLCGIGNTTIIAAIHAGWRGAVSSVIENTVKTMMGLGSRAIYAAIGPCIQKNSFQVGSDISSVVDKKYFSKIGENIFFDMTLLIEDKLGALGVKNLAFIDVDTFSNEDFFSYRRQNGHCGVQFSGICIRADV